MHRIILFKGGMCGDLVTTMLSPRYCSGLTPKLRLRRERREMKQHYRYDTEAKWAWHRRWDGTDQTEHSCSHDTEFSRGVRDRVTQLVAAPHSLAWFSERFWTRNGDNYQDTVRERYMTHRREHRHADYRLFLEQWQREEQFPDRFDVTHVRSPDFPDRVARHFGTDPAWASRVHQAWLRQEQRWEAK